VRIGLSTTTRTIVHVDMDAFFCAVETLHHPEYAGKCLIVGGYKDTPRAVVSSCSYEARRFGVHSAMPIAQAARLCPQGIFVPPHMALYKEASAKLHALFRQFSPVVEPLSIDEAFLDMTGCEHFYSDLNSMGKTIQEQVYATTGCTASVGIAPCKFLAKLASDLRKPKGLCIITEADIDTVLLPLPVSRLWGVGEKTAQVLAQHHVYTVAELRAKSLVWLQNTLGVAGAQLYELARGIDHRPVEAPGPAKSIGHEVTFPVDITLSKALKVELPIIAQAVAHRLQRDGRYGQTVVIKVRFSDFTTLTRQQTLPNSIVAVADILRVATSLLNNIKETKPIRLLGIYIADLTTHQQLSLFGDPRKHKIEQLLRQLKEQDPSCPITTATTLSKRRSSKHKEGP
jgi:DNA polymerase-4